MFCIQYKSLPVLHSVYISCSSFGIYRRPWYISLLNILHSVYIFQLFFIRCISILFFVLYLTTTPLIWCSTNTYTCVALRTFSSLQINSNHIKHSSSPNSLYTMASTQLNLIESKNVYSTTIIMISASVDAKSLLQAKFQAKSGCKQRMSPRIHRKMISLS